ncbi:YgaP family membrane protein [Colwellia piezophila]|uniref:YgaP family membrane protein n=1 Tax=Colwellia piezophila TaxID=211668 RepID=UPI00035D0501|nr:DUF2892 domain-containing protein [Colwellia piezophila]
MTINEALRLTAGIFILLSLYLAINYTQDWLWFTAFIAANLILSAFTKFCFMMSVFRKLGFKED